MKFDKATYDPKSESTSAVAKDGILALGTKTIKVGEDERLSCLCGCGGTPKGKNSKFVMGHDARLKGKLTRAHLTDTPIVIFTDGKAGKQQTARALCKDLGWDGILEAAEDRQKAVDAKQAEIQAKKEAVAKKKAEAEEAKAERQAKAEEARAEKAAKKEAAQKAKDEAKVKAEQEAREKAASK